MLTPGTRLSIYEIVRPLGAGGMGEVYLAKDTRLDREIALKVLRPEVAADPERRRRFTREARSCAKLSHPNTVRIYEASESDRLCFIAMEYVAGETLSRRLGAPLPSSQIVDIAAQVTEALEEAHSKGIIHRDIKPGNIMITPRGQAKLLDFGLARMVDATPASSEAATRSETEVGVLLGTIQYMSPEQALGRKLDHRSDLFSLGSVLYEMATGRRPFAGASQMETLTRIVNSQPDAISRFNYEVAPELERIIRKCLEKDRERRYQSARDLLIDLRNRQRDSTVTTDSGAGVSRWITRKSTGIAAAVVLFLALVALAGWWWLGRRPATASLAVLPLVNAGGPDLEYLSDGLTESIISNVSQLRRLRVLSRNAVFRFKGRENDAQQIGQRLGVASVLTGRITPRGDSLVIGVELVDVATNRQIWGRQYSVRQPGLLSVQEEMAQEISESLNLSLSGAERKLLTRQPTENSEAYHLYLKGRYHWNKRTQEGLRTAVDFFQQAVAKDPQYALAYAGLADTYTLQSGLIPPREIFPKAKAAAIRALELEEALAEGHSALALIKLHYDWDWLDTEREFKRAIQLNPSYPTAHSSYARFLNAMGRFPEAIEQTRLAQELDPLALGISAGVGLSHYFRREYGRAIEQYEKTLQIEPSFAVARANRGVACLQTGELREAIAALEAVVKEYPDDSGYLADLGHALGFAGYTGPAREYAGKLEAMSKVRFVSATNLALAYLGLGEKSKALAFLEKGYEDRAWPMIFLKVEPRYDALRGEPAFQSLMRRMAFPGPQ